MPTFLTERQKSILDFIRQYHHRHGFSPTYREIRDHFGYSSYGTVRKHLRLLEEKGRLRHISNQTRGLELLDDESDRSGAEDVPFFGLIAAGKPIEAVAGDETLAVPDHLLGGGRDGHYVLKVVGESMIDEGIFDGDLVVVRRREVASAGEMIVALVGEAEVTLKRFFPEGEKVRLEPSNPAMSPIWVAADDLAVQGIVVGLMRKF